jgi:hypothetical protein
MDLAMVFALIGCVLFGFAAGLFSFKVKSRWCPRCGVALRCPACRRTPHDAVRSRPADDAHPQPAGVARDARQAAP